MNQSNKNIDNTYCVNGDFSELANIRDFIINTAAKFGFPDDESCKIALAVDEACTNLIKHAFTNNIPKEICISIEITQNQFVVSIYDSGNPFNPLDFQQPNMQEYFQKFKKGGLGIHIMRSVMDKISYQPSDNSMNKNVLRLIKFLPPSN